MVQVGGWDPDWISEDWHMFLKCFLRCGGAVRLCPIFLPVVNYTPEDSTWLGTLLARWTQVCVYPTPPPPPGGVRG